MKNLSFIFQLFFAGVIIYLGIVMLRITIPYLSFSYEVDFLLTKQNVLHVASWRWAFYIHIITSLVVLVTGGFQFFKSILMKYPKIHKTLGKVYIFLVLVFSAPSGLLMGYYANGGFWAKSSFILLSIFWWVFTYIGYRKIRQGDVKAHMAFMIRGYSLTLSAIMLRTYVLILPFFFLLHAREMYTLVAWLSWIPNLIVAEMIIYFKNAKN